jgi:hypothetical protein
VNTGPGKKGIKYELRETLSSKVMLHIQNGGKTSIDRRPPDQGNINVNVTYFPAHIDDCGTALRSTS